jgi:quinol monooxygenase YgiN
MRVLVDQTEKTLPVHRFAGILRFDFKPSEGEAMLAVIARLNVAGGKEADFEKHMLGLAEQVRANEPGNEMYTLCKDEDGNYIVLELYKDAEALAAHGASEHFKAAGAGFRGLMAGAPDITRLEVVG